MLSFQWIRKAIRIGFASFVLAGLMLGFLTLAAHAAPTTVTKPETQLDDTIGGGGHAGQKRIVTIATQAGSEDHLISNFSTEVHNRERIYDGQYISGRESEVATLDDNFGIAEGRTVLVQGEGGSGRTALLEEYLRTHPQDVAYRLNSADLAKMSDDEAIKALNRIILRLEEENIKAADSHRVILFVDNVAALQRPQYPEPLQAIWQNVVRRANLYFFLEADSPTAKGQLNAELSRFKNIAGLVKTQTVLPAQYDDVLAYLQRNRATYEATGIQVSHRGYEEAARLSVRHYNSSPFKYADLLIMNSIKLIKNEQNSGVSTAEKTKMEIRKLEQSIQSLNQDLEHETDAEEKASLQTKLQAYVQQLETKQGDLAILNTPSSSRQQLRKVDLDLTDLTEALAHEEASHSMFSSRKAAINTIKQQIAVLTQLRLELENEITSSEPAQGKPATRVGAKQIVAIASKWLKIDPKRLEANFDEGIRKIQEIKLEVFGQDHAIDALESALITNHTKLREGSKNITPDQAELIKKGLLDDSLRPIGSFWFAGSTGVGKTETAVQLSEKLGYNLIVFDMSEYQQSHETSKLIGAPPGFKGMDSPGALTEAVRLNPQSVLVLDEIEKAHPDVLKFMLQVLDKGRMTDNQGRVIDFRQSVIIFTSNLAQEIGTWDEQKTLDFLKRTGGYDDEKIMNAIKGDANPLNTLRREAYGVYVTNKDLARERGFNPMPPEIFARIDNTVLFNNLTKENAIKIAEKTVKNFVMRLKALYKVDLRFSPEALTQYIGYFNEREGGRSMRRGFDKIFRAPVARLMFEQQAEAGETLLLDVNEQHMLEWKTSTPQEVAEAESKSAHEAQTAPKDEWAEAKQGLLFEEDRLAEAQKARGATGELMRKIFSPEWLISERAFRWIKR